MKSLHCFSRMFTFTRGLYKVNYFIHTFNKLLMINICFIIIVQLIVEHLTQRFFRIFSPTYFIIDFIFKLIALFIGIMDFRRWSIVSTVFHWGTNNRRVFLLWTKTFMRLKFCSRLLLYIINRWASVILNLKIISTVLFIIVILFSLFFLFC